MRISDWSSDVCSSDLRCTGDSLAQGRRQGRLLTMRTLADVPAAFPPDRLAIVHGAARWTWGDLDRRSAQWCAWLTSRGVTADDLVAFRSEEHTSELQSLMRISYAVFCLKKKNYTPTE